MGYTVFPAPTGDPSWASSDAGTLTITSTDIILDAGEVMVNGDVEVQLESGVVLHSPDNSSFRIVVSNIGLLSTQAV